MSAIDRLNFSREKIFKSILENLQKSDGKTKNLVDCRDDIIFFWDNKGKRLLTQTAKGLNRESSVYQELYPSESPVIDIDFIRLNSSVTKVALWGSQGVMVMDIPKRWGTQSGFQGGKLKILTRCTTIDMKYVFLNDSEVRQVRFHPGSPHDNHLVILTSDNHLRLYKLPTYDWIEESVSETELVNTWVLGQQPTDGKGWNLSGSKVPFLVGLGDVAVDFDFGLPIVNENNKDETDTRYEEVIWPTVVLRGNGDICYLNAAISSNQKSNFEGPLPMYPPADDNYGVEACSVLVLATVPSVIVVATSSGTLYHSVLLKIDKNEKDVTSSPSHALYVMECVELELGIELNDDDSSYNCPIILHRDSVSRWKYYSSHNAGLHAVSVSFVKNLETFFEASAPEGFRSDQPSTVEYLVCTRTTATPVLPVLGFTIIPSTNLILSLLANGDVISLPLKITEVLFNSGTLSEEIVGTEMTPIKKLLQEPFDVHIRNILQRKVNQPLIKLDKNVNLTPQESLDLISRTTNVLRQEYFTKFQVVRDEIEQRVTTLRALKSLHLNELSQLEKEKANLQAMAEKLAEKYEEMKDKQQILNQRIEKIVSSTLELESIESLAEKKMKNELVAAKDKVEYFEESIRTLKKRVDYQKFKKAEHAHEKQRSVQLGGNQTETIKNSLNKTSQEIADLVKTINSFKKQLNLSDA